MKRQADTSDDARPIDKKNRYEGYLCDHFSGSCHVSTKSGHASMDECKKNCKPVPSAIGKLITSFLQTDECFHARTAISDIRPAHANKAGPYLEYLITEGFIEPLEGTGGNIDIVYVDTLNDTDEYDVKTYYVFRKFGSIPSGFPKTGTYFINYQNDMDLHNLVFKNELQNIVIYSSPLHKEKMEKMENISWPDELFYANCHLRSVHFGPIPQVISVGKHFLSSCINLERVSFQGLTYLRWVNAYWLKGCTSLKSVDLHGLRSLYYVGDYWLSDCTSLTSVDLHGLVSLNEVEAYWLSGCTSLTVLNGWESLEKIDSVGTGVLNSTPCLKKKFLADLGLRKNTE